MNPSLITLANEAQKSILGGTSHEYWVVRIDGLAVADAFNRSEAVAKAVRARSGVAGLREIVAERLKLLSEQIERCARQDQFDVVADLLDGQLRLTKAYHRVRDEAPPVVQLRRPSRQVPVPFVETAVAGGPGAA